MKRSLLPCRVALCLLVTLGGISCKLEFNLVPKDALVAEEDAAVSGDDAGLQDGSLQTDGCGLGDGSSDADVVDATGSVCGDQVLQEGEDCDGTDLGGRSCVTEGWVAGHLACDEVCRLDASDCRNSCGIGPSGPCPASSVQDDFNGAEVARFWSDPLVTGNLSFTVTDGQLVVDAPCDATGYVVLTTENILDLVTYETTVEMVQPFEACNGEEVTLAVENGDESVLVGLGVVRDSLILYRYDGDSTPLMARPFDPDAHHYLRLSALGELLMAETSPDGHVWTEIGVISAPFPMDQVRLSLLVGIWRSCDVALEARLDQFNILP